MCGICGEFRMDSRPPDEGTLARMLARLEQRGPDHEGRYLIDNVALGHRRLSVIDLSAASNQPWVDEVTRTGAGFQWRYIQLQGTAC